MATSPTPNTDRNWFPIGPDACGSGVLLPKSKADSLEHVYTAFGLWKVSLIFPRKLVKPPVYKGFSICYTFPPPALGNTDVCIPQRFLSLKGLFSPACTILISQSLDPGSQGEILVQGIILLVQDCCKCLLTCLSRPRCLPSPDVLPTLKSDKSSENRI